MDLCVHRAPDGRILRASLTPGPGEAATSGALNLPVRSLAPSVARQSAHAAVQEAQAAQRAALAAVQQRAARPLAPVQRMPQQLARTVARQLPAPAPQQLAQHGVREVKRAASSALQPIASEALRSMNLPSNIPVALPTSAEPKAIADAAYKSAKGYAENLIQQKTGIPIKLPTKLTAKEIGRSLGSVIPTDVEEAVDLALNVGAQVATQALTGATIGSIIPGAGTLIGIGVALGVQAIKSAFKAKPNPSLRKCKTKWSQKNPPPNSNAFQLIAWATREGVPLSRALAHERADRYCGVGAAVTYSDALGTMRRDAIAAALGSAPTMSLPDVDAALQVLAGIPDGTWHYDTRPGSPTEKQVIWDRYVDALPKVIEQLQHRKRVLTHYVTQVFALDRMNASQLAQARWSFVHELAVAARAYQSAPTPANAKWLRDTSVALRRLTARTQKVRQQMAAKLQAARQRGAQRLAADPRARAQHSAQIEAFLRSERQR